MRYEQPRAVGFPEAAGELRAALVEATACRALSAGRLTADLSGGLDSTSLVLLTTRVADTEVLAVTHADATSRNEDVAYAQRAAAGRVNLKHAVIEDRDGLFFDDLLCAPATDQPFPDAARWRMRAAYQQVCVDYGSTTHLTGSGADTLLSVSPYYLADLAREGNVRALWEHALGRARLRRLPVHSVLNGAVRLSRTTHALGLQRLAEEITAGPVRPARRESPARLHWCTSSGARAWLTADARRYLARRACEAAEICHVMPAQTSRHRWLAELGEFGTYEAELRNQAQATGLPHHAPFRDNAVVRPALAVPIHERASTTVQKPLLGAALRDLVPDWLLTRRTKGAYDGNAYIGLRRNTPVLRELITNGRLAAEGWIDATAAVTELERLAIGVPGRLAALEALVATELWMHQHRRDGAPTGTTHG